MAKGYKTGGRQKGTPNKDNPLKGLIRAHSLKYFEDRVQTDPITGGARQIQRKRLVQDEEGNVYNVIDLIPLTDPATGQPLVMSDLDADMMALSPAERVNAELRLMEFHTPRMKSQDINMEINMGPRTIEDTLKALCAGEEDAEDE